MDDRSGINTLKSIISVSQLLNCVNILIANYSYARRHVPRRVCGGTAAKQKGWPGNVTTARRLKSLSRHMSAITPPCVAGVSKNVLTSLCHPGLSPGLGIQDEDDYVDEKKCFYGR